MLVLITNQVPMKVRGFLAACLLEVAPGVYVHPRINAGVRERIWKIMTEWSVEFSQEAFVLALWPAPKSSGGINIRTIGIPQRTLIDYDGLVLSKLTSADTKALES